MNFYDILKEVEQKKAYNPYAGKVDGEWVEGQIDIDFLNNNFGEYETATEMKENTDSEGLIMFFDYLVEKGKLPK